MNTYKYPHTRRWRIVILSLFLLVAMACGLSSPKISTPATQDPLNATLSELQGSVQARQAQQSNFEPAKDGLVLSPDGQVKTLTDGRARLDLSSGTIVRVAPSTVFTLISNQETDKGLKSRLHLDLGKIWIILNGGSLEVETPSGLASVRGSYMSVESLPNGQILVTCLEGNCTLGNQAGSVELTGGQTATITDATTPPTTGTMTEEQVNEWLQENPEAKVVVDNLPAQSPPELPTPTSQPPAEPVSYGPNLGDFPQGYNPLTGQPVDNPSNLNLPAILVSISHFPANVSRPQAGLSFAPMVFEISIGEGETRFLTAFYGDFPAPGANITGGCEVRSDPFDASGTLLGNRVWIDLNANGIQDELEPGVGGVCVNLYDAPSGDLLQETSTDSNGYYGFNVDPNGSYVVEVVKPDKMDFTQANVGNDGLDSDVNPSDGRTQSISLTGNDLTWDTGLMAQPEQLTVPEDINANVGPVRSGRIAYMPIVNFFPGSCIIQAGATKEIVKDLRVCGNVFGPDPGAGAMLDISRLENIALQNATPGATINYSSNTFTDQPPAGGQPASDLRLFYSNQDQTKWYYDPIYQSWLRFVDDGTKQNAGVFHPDVDRLNGRQVHFENVIVLFAEHQRVHNNALIIQLMMDIGEHGDAYLFRDGMMYPIKWSTTGSKNGQRQVIQFQDADGQPFPLKPGHTWVHIVNLGSTFYQDPEGSSSWVSRFYAP